MESNTEFVFTRMETKDLEWFLSIRNSVSQNLHNSEQFTIQQCKEWFSTTKISYFIVEVTIEGSLTRCGYFRLRELDTQGMAEIGMDLHPEYQGKNIAFQAYKAFAIFLKDNFGLSGFTLRVKKDNARAIKLYERLKFEIVGEYEHETYTEFLMFSSVKRLGTLPA